MADKAPPGFYWINVPGFDKPFQFPDHLDRQTAMRSIRQKFPEEFARYEQQYKAMGAPTPGEAFTLGMGQTGEMMADFLNKPRIDTTPERVAPFEERAAQRPITGEYIRRFEPDAFDYGTMLPYFTPPAGAASRPIAGLMRRLGVSRLPGAAGMVPEYVGRSVVADTMGQGALLGAMTDDGSALEGAAYGGAGGFLGKALSRALRPADTTVDPYMREMLETGEGLGYQLTPAQRTGSTGLAKFEDAMENNLLMSGGMEKTRQANQQNSNRIVAEALGFKDYVTANKRITPEMLDQVSDRFNQRFDSLTDGQAVRLDSDEFIDQLVRLEAENVDYPLYNKDFKDTIDRTLDLIVKGDGWLSGEQYQTLSSKLVKGIRAGFKPNSGQQDFAAQLVELKDALDDSAMESLGSDVLQRFRDVRSDYRTFANLMKNSVINEDTGDVSLRQLGNVLRRDDKYGYRRGKNESDLYEATRFTRATQGDGVNSLTARRQSLPQTMIASGLFGMMGYGAEDDGVGVPLAAAASVPASMWLMGRYYNSKMGRRHFGKGLLPPISDEFRRFLGQKIGLGAIAGSQTGMLPQLVE